MTGPLVSVDLLSQHIGDPNWAIFDCRFDLSDVAAGMNAYLKGHIAGAHFADLEKHLSGAKNGGNGRHPLPEREHLVEFLRQHGVGQDTQLVAYDQRDGMYAARFWWLLRWLGHRNVAVLDGGLEAWQEAGMALDDHLVTVSTEGDFQAHLPLTEPLGLAAMLDSEADGMIIIDARAGPRYRGEVEPIDRVAGHIPGALNRPYTENLDARGRFLKPEQLRDAFINLIGSQDSSKVVNQCGSGVTACHNLLAMEVAGLQDSKLYAGSWSEWSSDPARPVATGPNP
jgi:thiosulfate/3-mercaptopyruvate sulfurtransferase